jgi:hypothetical protein
MPLRDAYFLISGKFYSSHIGDVFGRKEYGSLTFPHTQNFLSPDRVPLPAHPRDDHHVPHGARKTLEAFSSTLRDKIDRSLPRRGWRTHTTLKTPSQAPEGILVALRVVLCVVQMGSEDFSSSSPRICSSLSWILERLEPSLMVISRCSWYSLVISRRSLMC